MNAPLRDPGADAQPARLQPPPKPRVLRIAAPPKADTQTAQKPAATASLSRFVDLEIEARQCADLENLRLMIVNATSKLAAFDQALIAEPSPAGSWRVTSVSSLARIDRHAPFLRIFEKWLNQASNVNEWRRAEPRQTDIARDMAQWGLEAVDIPAPQALCLPLRRRDGTALAVVILLNSDPWTPQHFALLLPLAGAYAHSWDALTPRRDTRLHKLSSRLSKARVALSCGVVMLLAAFIPVPMSALAPAEIVARDPALVTAPLDGVIAELPFAPGAWVEKDQVIVKFVDIKLRNDLEVARRTQAVAASKYFKVTQNALTTQKDLQDVAMAKGEYELAVAEANSAQEQLSRTLVRAQRSGLLIYPAKSDLLGKPVAAGERLMEIGDPAQTEILVELPVSDAIALRPGHRVSLFLDGDPLRAISGRIERMNYRPGPTAEQQLAFAIIARFDESAPRRIGLRGVARLDGDDVSLWFYLLRRPVTTIRQRIGL